MGRWRGSRVDWVEAVLTGLGILFAILAVVSVIAVVRLITSIGEPITGFPAGEGFVKGARGLGLGLFAVASLVFSLVAWTLLAPRIRAALRKRRDRSDE
jgi:uncharacterized membrane protein